MPDEPTPVRRRGRRPKLDNDAPLMPTQPMSPTQPISPTATDNSLMGLPESIEIQFPDFANAAASAIGYRPNPELFRVTDAERAEDERVFREQLNASHNLRDSLKVAQGYVEVGIQATKLGKALVEYRIGVENIRNAEVGLQKAQTQTAISRSELSHLQAKLEFSNNLLPQVQTEYQHKLTEAVGRADRARRKAVAYLHETENLFPTEVTQTINVQPNQ